VTNGVNDDFVAGHFVENKVRVGRRCHAPDARSDGSNANEWIKEKEVDDGLNAF
jgi:hypothetical protein